MNYELRVFDPSTETAQLVSFYNSVFAPLRPYYSWPLTVAMFQDKVLSHWEFRREGVWCAWAGNELVGFVLASFRNQPLLPIDQLQGDWSPVFISAIAVAPEHRRRGLGRQLVNKAVEFARAHGRTRVAVSANPRAPMAFFIGVQEDWRDAHWFLTSVGFSFTGMTQNLARGIIGFVPEPRIQQRIAELHAQGYECRVYQNSDYPALVRLLDDHGWAYWHLDMLSKVGKWTTTRPFMETCFLECTTDEIRGPDEIGVVMKDGQMLAFCAQTLNPRRRIACLGPMLTAKEARNQGLGTVALQVSVELAARKGMVLCDLWTGYAGPITHYYEKSGFRQVLKWFDYAMPAVRAPGSCASAG